MLKIARIAIKKNAAFSDCIMVFGVKPYIVAFFFVYILLQINSSYTVAVSFVQPLGIPLTPVTSHVAEAFFTNVPVEATPFTQERVYVVLGVVVNIALMYSNKLQP